MPSLSQVFSLRLCSSWVLPILSEWTMCSDGWSLYFPSPKVTCVLQQKKPPKPPKQIRCLCVWHTGCVGVQDGFPSFTIVNCKAHVQLREMRMRPPWKENDQKKEARTASPGRSPPPALGRTIPLRNVKCVKQKERLWMGSIEKTFM